MAKTKVKLSEGDVAIFTTKEQLDGVIQAAAEAGVEFDEDSTSDFNYHPALKYVDGKLKSDKGTTGNVITPEEFITRLGTTPETTEE